MAHPTPKTNRLSGFGASASGALVHELFNKPAPFGKTAYSTCRDMITARMGGYVENLSSIPMAMGHALEPMIREQILKPFMATAHPTFVVQVSGNDATHPVPCAIEGVLSSPDTLYLSASGILVDTLPDGEYGAEALAKCRGLEMIIGEIKTCSKDYDTEDDIPWYYKWQVEHQARHLETFGIRVVATYIAWLNTSSKKFGVVQIPRWDRAEADKGWELIRQTWEGVLQGVTPAPYTVSETLQAQPTTSEESVITPFNAPALVAEARYLEAKGEAQAMQKLADQAKERKDQALADLLKVLGKNPKKITGSNGKSLASRIDTVRVNVDSAKLKTLDPQIFEQVSTTSTSTYYR